MAIPQSPSTDFTSTTLNGSINDSVTTITVNDASTINTPCYAVIDREDNNGVATPNQREVVKITGKSSNDLTVTRGVNNSTRRAHNDSAKFEPVISVGFWDDFYDAYDADHNPADGTHDIAKVAMLSGATVQTVANKILSGATIIQPTMTILQGASVAPTVEGDLRWRTGDDSLMIGDGTNTSVSNLGAWKSWTPQTSNLSGGSIVYAKYSQIGKTVNFRFKYYMSGANVEAAVTLTTPTSINTSIAVATEILGQSVLVESGTASNLGVFSFQSATEGRIRVAQVSATNITLNSDVTKTIPHTWGDTDIIYISGTYEAA